MTTTAAWVSGHEEPERERLSTRGFAGQPAREFAGSDEERFQTAIKVGYEGAFAGLRHYTASLRRSQHLDLWES